MNALSAHFPIAATHDPLLERALVAKLRERGAVAGSLGELEPMAVRIGLMQHTLKPRLQDPHLLIFAADHGLAVDGLHAPNRLTTQAQVEQLLLGRLPASVFARQQQMALTVVDAGVAARLPRHEQLLVRKISHGTRNARMGPAMSPEQAQAAIRAGVEIAEALPGGLLAFAGIGVGAHVSAALLMSRLTDAPVRDLMVSGPGMNADALAHLMALSQGAQARHAGVTGALEALAAFGGYETAMMVGAMLAGASRRRLLMIDGMPALAALMVAERLAPAITDYGVFCRSSSHQGLDRALSLFRAAAVLELGLDGMDGTGATLAWPLIRCAAALLTDVVDGEDPGPSQPADLDALPPV